MILYTPLSQEDIYQNEMNADQYTIITYQEKQCYAEKMDDGNYRLLQLLSTDPNDYLQECFTPGNIIHQPLERRF